ncbi:MAG: tRNA (adenosine(37)-N6)-threonylcarbamoyltransferase complex ATPase subunit type 1 TsaE [Candidatus Falkowbacteria bacterium]
MKQFITSTPEETFVFGENLGKNCQGGEVFLLSGDLGAGKTCLTQGLARGLGVKGKVNSPTFNIMKIYKTKIGHLCHIDAYRLNSGSDLKMIGLDDYLEKKDTVVVIEWAEKVKSVWPKNRIRIKIKNVVRGRKIEVT